MADRTHWHDCWRVHHECAVTEVERLRAQVADPDGRLWRDRAHDCARDVREALGHERDAHIIWSQVVQMVREQRERTERLEAIVRELVALGPSDTYGSCLLCGTDYGAPHEPDCLWLRARQEVGDDG